MSETEKKTKISIRTRRFLTNRLLNRRQFVVEVEHPGKGTVPRKDVQAKIGEMFKVKDAEKTVVVFNLKTHFGGGKSTGFGLIYDNASFCKRYEPKYRLLRMGLAKKKEGSRKQRKEKKNKMKKYRGTNAAKAAGQSAKKK
eukprot:NODE_8904_length_635_cov_28.955078_g8279_i0.p1 GENE.NODE_8904_length_635_cov_28.955078_g8279_i0~~NODE_8904_length_635_cov_28.955078_g8279_i0.p1  ORF type:complete len:141 (+),score=25.98 NODE_8904_length_635_cov_28.955078_g8279_i0:171-593(+)